MSKKLSAKTVWFLVVYVALCVTSQNVADGLLTFGLFVGGLYCANPLLVAVPYLVGAFLYGKEAVINTAVRIAVMLLFVFIHKLCKRKIGKLYLLLYLLLANVFYLIYGFTDYFNLFDKTLYVACGIAFSYVSVYAFRAVFERGLNYRPALDELVCIAIFAVVLSFCISKITLWGMEAIYLVIPFCALFCTVVFKAEVALMASALVGLGNVLATSQFGAFACAVVSAACAVAFCRLSRFVGALSVVAVDVIMSYYWNLHGRFETLVFAPTLVSVLVFVVIPGSVYKYLADYFCGDAQKYLGKTVQSKLGTTVSRRLYRLSDIFLSMKNAFYSMSAGHVSPEQAQVAIVRQCVETVCADCERRQKCWRTDLAQTEGAMQSLASSAVRRGKCSILDVPQTLSVKCNKVSSLISYVNTQSRIYLDYVDKAEQADGSKLLLGEQMGGVSDLLLSLASDCKGRIGYDSDKEKELVDRLVFHNVMCVGATIIAQSGVLAIIATVSQKDFNADVICKVTSGLVKQKVVVDKLEQTDSAAWINVVMKVDANYDAEFGVASAVKGGSEASGDTHSVVQTDNGKCIVTLCDGMGSGNGAEKASATAIGLVESFYRAGFDNDVILSCINKLLSGVGNETFCAVDIVALDRYNGLADFIKLGATVGLVKSKGQVELISGSSLPLGVLEEMKPSITKKALCDGDLVVLLSDGVVDCFDSPSAVASALAQTTLTTPQSIAEYMLARAKKLCGTPKDDMTVLCFRLVKKYSAA